MASCTKTTRGVRRLTCACHFCMFRALAIPECKSGMQFTQQFGVLHLQKKPKNISCKQQWKLCSLGCCLVARYLQNKSNPFVKKNSPKVSPIPECTLKSSIGRQSGQWGRCWRKTLVFLCDPGQNYSTRSSPQKSQRPGSLYQQKENQIKVNIIRILHQQPSSFLLTYPLL